jgi:membrane protease YdiL (CAAX protease family)
LHEDTLDPSPPTARHIFFGADGLRAGWSLFLYVILLAAPLFVLKEIHRVHPAPKPPASHRISPSEAYFSETIEFTYIVFATWIMSRIERRPNSVYGLGVRGRLPQFLAGLFWGVLSLSLLVAILWKLHLLIFDARLLSSTMIFSNALIWLVGFLLVGLSEEYLMRGYLQFTLARGLTGIASLFAPARSKTLGFPRSGLLGFWTSALILSFLFGAGHGSNPGESPFGLLSTGLAGLVFCLSLWRTGSLWWAIGFHCTWDWAQSFLYGVADSGTMIEGRLFATHPVGEPLMSGAATGPEGSLFVLPILAIVAIIIIATLPTRRHSDAASDQALP